jgi:organic hydroperoxide reductase OsmC/OhrA
MKPLPHHYTVTASASGGSDVALMSPGLARFMSAAPKEFDGPGDRWSPETLLVGAVADCFVLTFRAIAGAMRLNWIDIVCEGTGTVGRMAGTTLFTSIELHATLKISDANEVERARDSLARTEKVCLISNSLRCDVIVRAEVIAAGTPAELLSPTVYA